jgi:ribosomal protein L15E
MAFWMMAWSWSGLGMPFDLNSMVSSLAVCAARVPKLKILHAFEAEDGNVAIKEVHLIDDNNPAIGNNPKTKVVFGPHRKGAKGSE